MANGLWIRALLLLWVYCKLSLVGDCAVQFSTAAPPPRREMSSQPARWTSGDDDEDFWSSDDDYYSDDEEEDEMYQLDEAHMHPHAAYRRQHHKDYAQYEGGQYDHHPQRNADRHAHHHGHHHGAHGGHSDNHRAHPGQRAQQQGHGSPSVGATHPAPHPHKHHHHAAPGASSYFQLPRLYKHSWISDLMSHFHELVCIIMYCGLIYKIHTDKVAVGISAQTLGAMFISELVSLLLRYAEIRRHGEWDWSIVYTDFRSTALACACTVMVWLRSRWHAVTLRQDNHRDAFGMNILSGSYFLIANCTSQLLGAAQGASSSTNTQKSSNDRIVMMWSSPDGEDVALEVRMAFLYKRDVHFGHLRPLGVLGSIFHRTYWLALHLFVAVPMALFFIMLRQFVGGVTTKTAFAVAYGDAVRAAALIPQLYMYETRKTRAISQQLLFFVVCEGVLRLTALLFWLTYPLFHHMSRHGYLSRNYAVIVQLINLAVVARLVSTLFNPSNPGGGIEKITESLIPMTEAGTSTQHHHLEGGSRFDRAEHSYPTTSSSLRKPRTQVDSH